MVCRAYVSTGNTDPLKFDIETNCKKIVKKNERSFRLLSKLSSFHRIVLVPFSQLISFDGPFIIPNHNWCASIQITTLSTHWRDLWVFMKCVIVLMRRFIDRCQNQADTHTHARSFTQIWLCACWALSILCTVNQMYYAFVFVSFHTTYSNIFAHGTRARVFVYGQLSEIHAMCCNTENTHLVYI